jgi:hypothetical protein
VHHNPCGMMTCRAAFAGILALPAVTQDAGFVPSLAALAGCCAFSIATGEAQPGQGRQRQPVGVAHRAPRLAWRAR